MFNFVRSAKEGEKKIKRKKEINKYIRFVGED